MEMTEMSRVRLGLVSLVSVLSVAAAVASSASAEINFEWKVSGARLGLGSTELFTLNTDGRSLALNGTLPGAAFLLLSNKILVKPGAQIVGGVPGVPGTGEAVILFENTEIQHPNPCDILNNVITTKALKIEVVEAAPGSVGDGEPILLFTPKISPTFAAFEILGPVCPVKGLKVEITGSVLGLLSPPKVEAKQSDLIFESITKEYKVSTGGAAKVSGLVLAENPATLTGLTLMILNSGDVFGAF